MKDRNGAIFEAQKEIADLKFLCNESKLANTRTGAVLVWKTNSISVE